MKNTNQTLLLIDETGADVLKAAENTKGTHGNGVILVYWDLLLHCVFVFWEFDSSYTGQYMLTAAVSWICFPGWEFDSCTIISRAEQENTPIIAIILLYEIQCQYNAI